MFYTDNIYNYKRKTENFIIYSLETGMYDRCKKCKNRYFVKTEEGDTMCEVCDTKYEYKEGEKEK